MTPKINCQIILALSISLTFIACNENGKKTGEAETNDTTVTAKTETIPPPAQNMDPDAVKAAPNLYSVVTDTLGIRVLEVTYKPGDSSVMHSHPDYALYSIAGGTSAFTGKDG